MAASDMIPIIVGLIFFIILLWAWYYLKSIEPKVVVTIVKKYTTTDSLNNTSYAFLVFEPIFNNFKKVNVTRDAYNEFNENDKIIL